MGGEGELEVVDRERIVKSRVEKVRRKPCRNDAEMQRLPPPPRLWRAGEKGGAGKLLPRTPAMIFEPQISQIAQMRVAFCVISTAMVEIVRNVRANLAVALFDHGYPR
jgi:hypothetical protein